MNDKISVIIPLYNAEKTLSKCLENILKQSYSNLEIILVNDGSIDKTELIAKKYKRKDNRIIYLYKKNGGVSSARNFGLNIAKGKWITFCDSDDYVDKNWLENYFIYKNTDLSIQGLNIKSNNKEKKSIIFEKYGIIQKESKFTILLDMFLFDERLLKSPWNKCFLNKKIKDYNIKFIENQYLGEDFLFILNYMRYANNISIVNKSAYNYILENSTLSKKKYSVNILIEWSENFREEIKHLRLKYNNNLFFDYILYDQILRLFRNGYLKRMRYKERKDIIIYFKRFNDSIDKRVIKIPYKLIWSIKEFPISIIDLTLICIFKVIKITKKIFNLIK